MSRLARPNPSPRTVVDPFTGAMCSWIASQVVHDLPPSFESKAVWLASVVALQFVLLVALVGLHQLLARRNRWVAAAAWGVLALTASVLHDVPEPPLPPVEPWRLAGAVAFLVVSGAAMGCAWSWFTRRWMPGPARPEGPADA